MKKRFILIALICCMLFSMVACSKDSHSQETVEYPGNWDVNAEMLRFCNGFFHAKTVDQLKPYVVAETSDKKLQECITEQNSTLEGMVDTLDYRDYPYDSVEVTLLRTYKNYELFWVETTSVAFEEAVENLSKNELEPLTYTTIGASLLCVVTIENGRYVSTFDEALTAKVVGGYDYCNGCRGTGEQMVFGLVCSECGGAGTIFQNRCNDCGELVYAETGLPQFVIMPEASDGDGSVGQDSDGSEGPVQVPGLAVNGNIAGMGLVCPACQSTNIATKIVPCESCATQEPNGGSSACPVCDGNGWIKN